MGSEDPVKKEDCKDCKQSMQDQLDEHSSEIKGIQILLAEVVTLQKEMIRSTNAAEDRLRLVEAELMKHRGAYEERKLHKADPELPAFWKERWFSVIIITVCIVVVLITGAAVGQNIINEYVGAISQ